MAVALTMAIAPSVSSASVFGFLGNFDVVNDTGSTAHGFEIDLEGLHSSDITDTFGGEGRGFPSGRGYDPLTSVERYGAPTITEYSNGTTFGPGVPELFDAPPITGLRHAERRFITPGDSAGRRWGCYGARRH
jgi:hypothetical protein